MRDETDDEVAAEIAARVGQGIDALYARPPARGSDVERQLWLMSHAVAIAELDACVMALRPWTGNDPEGRGIEEYWLLPVAAALAIRWRIQGEDRAALARYRAEAKADAGEAKLDIMARAVLSVQAARESAAPIRIGTKWVTDEGGRKQAVVPTTLEYWTYLRWWVARCLREARTILREGVPDAGTDEAEEVNPTDALVGRQNTPLDDLELAEAAAHDRKRVDALYLAARDDTDRRLLDCLAEVESIAEAARHVGVTPELARQRITRLRARARRA
jgi:hypothetical protein